MLIGTNTTKDGGSMSGRWTVVLIRLDWTRGIIQAAQAQELSSSRLLGLEGKAR